MDVVEYRADVYYNSKTGERLHAAFPDGVVNDVNYDGSVKAFLFLLNTECCVSIDKSQKFLSDFTNGELKISRGMINSLSKEFSQKTADERKELYNRIMESPVMHIDYTNAHVQTGRMPMFLLLQLPMARLCILPVPGKAMKVSRVLLLKIMQVSSFRIIKNIL